MKKTDTMAAFALRLLSAKRIGTGAARGATVLVAMAAVFLPQMMHAQVPSNFKVIDGFTKGKETISATSGTVTKVQNLAAIKGWTRNITLTQGSTSASNNPYSQPIEIQVHPSPATGVAPAFVWSVGYGIFTRIDLQYYPQGSTPPSLNLASYDRFRVVFSGLSSILNFNFVAWQGTNNQGATCGINVPPYATQFTVDFLFNAYVFSDGTTLAFSDVSAMDVVFQGSSNLAITGIYAVPTGAVLNGPPGSPNGPATFICQLPPPPSASTTSH